MNWSFVMFFDIIILLVFGTMQCSARCEAPRNCSYIHNCTAETGLHDLYCYDLTSDSHRCGYRKDLPTELGVQIQPQSSIANYRRIPDNSFKASSNSDEARYARIGLTKSWCAENQNSDSWLEVDFGVLTDIERIELKGDPVKSTWEQKFSVSYSDGNNMKKYRNGFIYTSTKDDFCHYVFINQTKTIRIISNSTTTCFQLAIYGNPPDPQIIDVVQNTPEAPLPVQPTAKLLKSDALIENGFFDNYQIWAIFVGVFLFLLVFFLTYLLCWCCRRPREFDKSKLGTSKTETDYVPPWRSIDASAEHGYIATQEVQEVKIAFTDEYIPPNLTKEKQNPNDEKHYQHKIFSFQSRVAGEPASNKPSSSENSNK